MPNFLADLGRGGPAITNALTDVTKTALTLEQMKGEKQNQAIRDNQLRIQQFTFEKEQKEEERKNRIIPFKSAAQALRPEAKEGTKLLEEMYNFTKGLGYIETVGGEEVISERNIEAAIANFKGNEERFWSASLTDINNTITQLQTPPEKPLKPEETQARQQQLQILEARKTSVLNKLKGEEVLKLEREQKIKQQEIEAKASEAANKFGYDTALEITKGEEARKLEKVKATTKEKPDKNSTWESYVDRRLGMLKKLADIKKNASLDIEGKESAIKDMEEGIDALEREMKKLFPEKNWGTPFKSSGKQTPVPSKGVIERLQELYKGSRK